MAARGAAPEGALLHTILHTPGGAGGGGGGSGGGRGGGGGAGAGGGAGGGGSGGGAFGEAQQREARLLEAESENAFLKHELEELQHVVKRNEVMPRRAAPP